MFKSCQQWGEICFFLWGFRREDAFGRGVGCENRSGLFGLGGLGCPGLQLFCGRLFFFFLAIKAKAAALQCSPCCDIWMFTVNAIPCPWRGFFGSCCGGLQL